MKILDNVNNTVRDDLIVIDESHNFRNGIGTHSNTQENRYQKLMEKVIRAGVKSHQL